jgi:hypothetical protein
MSATIDAASYGSHCAKSSGKDSITLLITTAHFFAALSSGVG